MPLRIHTDENADVRIAEQLRRRDIDAHSARDLSLLGASDSEQFDLAVNFSAVFFTHDADLIVIAREWTASGKGHAGLIFVKKDSLALGEILRCLVQLAVSFDPDDFRDQIEFL